MTQLSPKTEARFAENDAFLVEAFERYGIDMDTLITARRSRRDYRAHFDKLCATFQALPNDRKRHVATLLTRLGTEVAKRGTSHWCAIVSGLELYGLPDVDRLFASDRRLIVEGG